jgi:hypothetical protein
MSHHLLLIDIRHYVRLSDCYRCGWHLKLKHLKLLLESDDHRCPLLELEVLLLEVYDCVCALTQHLMSDIELLAEVVPPVLSLAEAAVHDLQHAVVI